MVMTLKASIRVMVLVCDNFVFIPKQKQNWHPLGSVNPVLCGGGVKYEPKNNYTFFYFFGDVFYGKFNEFFWWWFYENFWQAYCKI